MSRSIKAIKLLHLLKDTYKVENKYIKVSVILAVLETDARNVRRIVSLLNESFEFQIESKTGRDGGYRLNSSIYSYFLGTPSEEIPLKKMTDLKLENSSNISPSNIVQSELSNIIPDTKQVELEDEEETVMFYQDDDDESEDDFIIL